MENYAVEFRNIVKRFPGAIVLKEVSFSINQGEVHALLGENGAGKSTLLNILHGVYSNYEGGVFLNGEKVTFKNTNDAIIGGHISMVHQEINVVEDLTVGQNITLGYEPSWGIFINYTKLNNKVNEILKKLRCKFTAVDMVYSLTAGEKQMLAIAKALFHNSKVISLDEPTASLTDNEAKALFEIITELKSDGITIIYVSHRLEEVFKICDRATILRDGNYIATINTKETTRQELIFHMVGKEIEGLAGREKESPKTDETVLEIVNLSRIGAFSNVSFKLHKGEILGFFGLVGAGRTEVMRGIFGADKVTSGVVYLSGEKVAFKNTESALKAGIGLLPEERKTEGFIDVFDNKDNAALSSTNKYMAYGFINTQKKLDNYLPLANKLKIRPKDPTFNTKNMSGGNQQKVILAKWLSTDVDIIIFDEPTKGIDVAAKMEIYQLMEELVHNGKSVIVVSSELPEVMGISDRIIVMHEGKTVAEIERESFNEVAVLNYAMGGKRDD